MRDNFVKQRLRAGHATIGAFLGLGSPTVAELMASSGLDWLVIETEHNALGVAEVQQLLMAMSGGNAIPLVRVPSADPVAIQRSLDIGAMGILVPMVQTADGAEAIVAATRYPPKGQRGFGPLRASRYGYDVEEYFAGSDENCLVALIIETAEALHNLDEIATVDGVDVLFVGPADLSLALGQSPIEPRSRLLDAAIAKILEVGKRRGVAVGMGAQTPDEVATLLERGVRWVAYGPEYRLLRMSIGEGVSRFRQVTRSGGT